MDYKSKMQNVSFGGGWSEELIERDETDNVLWVLKQAVNLCMETDTRSDEVEEALKFVETHIDKGCILAKQFRAALSFKEGYARYQESNRIFEILIRRFYND